MKIEKQVRNCLKTKQFIKLFKAEGFTRQEIERHIKQVIEKRRKENGIR